MIIVKKNKNGFTLTEILVVISILVVVTTGTMFGMDEVAKKTNEKRLNDLIKEIELAADAYITDNDVYRKALLNGEITEKCTKIYVLQNANLLDTELINPITNERIPGNLCVYSTLNANGIIENNFSLD